MLADLFNRIIEAARDGVERRLVLDVLNRTYRYEPSEDSYIEVLPRDDEKRAPKQRVGTVEALADWCNAMDGGGVVTIHPGRYIEAVSPLMIENHRNRNHCRKEFYDRYLPADRPLDYVEFVSFIDLLGDRLRNRESIEAAIDGLSAVDGQVSDVVNHGAAIRVRTVKEKGVNATLPVPKAMKARLVPYGDPDFKTDVHYHLTVSNRSGGLVFVLGHDPNDEARKHYAQWAKSALTEALDEEQWLILVGPDC